MSIVARGTTICNAKVVRGTGWAEGVEYHGSQNPLALSGQGSRRPGGGRGVPSGRGTPGQQDNKERAARRAKTNLRRKAKELYGKAEGRVYMVTLTYAENMQDYDQAYRDMRAFLQVLWRKYGRHQKLYYIAVPERQERGAWHWHILINLYLKHEVWSELWGHGFVWVGRIKSPRAAARYVAKYIAKTFEEDEGVPSGRHRYLTAHGLGDWQVEYSVVKDELGTWFEIAKSGQYHIMAVMSIPGEVAWWEAVLDNLCGCPGEGCVWQS